MDAICERVAREMNLPARAVENTARLLDEGNTIPFIARYRKEQHGALDDQVLRALADRLTRLRNLENRRQEILQTLTEREKLTPALEASIGKADTLTELEDLYRPFRAKRRTRASIARERGLEPLAEQLRRGGRTDPTVLAAPFVDPEKGVASAESALAGASDILAEELSDNAALRRQLRALLHRTGSLTVCAAKGAGDSVYQTYYDFSQAVSKLQSHQILAINRGEKEGLLKVSLSADTPSALAIISRNLQPRGAAEALLRACAADAWSRLIFPSLEREIRSELTDTASEQAIAAFALNLRPLLMQPPVKNRVTMGFDPGYRMGCKLAVVDGTGKVLDTGVIYPTPPRKDVDGAMQAMRRLVSRHHVTCIAIGNGTASGESEQFVARFIREYAPQVSYAVVSEAGASVYSASPLAAAEFPEYDVNLRSAVSIARRLQDPLSELVKIDPKALGVGQYQHDMPEKRLDEALNGVVEDCVNAVGVDVNVASAPLLERVAGITPALAGSIVAWRDAHGPFPDRKTLLQVPKLGPARYRQCAGFLRVPESDNVLDHTAVHPESYSAAEKLLQLCGYGLQDVGHLDRLPARLAELGTEQAAEACGVGVPTLQDIAAELQKPGRDPRDELPVPVLRSEVLEMTDLQPGMLLTGTVRNVCDFGAFVDIGVHQDGLVHISQLADRYVRHPSEVVQVGDVVKTVVLSVDPEKKRISLSMKQAGKQ